MALPPDSIVINRKRNSIIDSLFDSDDSEMIIAKPSKSKKNKALLVATMGVLFPFVLGTYLIGPLLMPGLSHNAYIFLGATLSATSVGITARVFKDFSILQTRESRIVLGADHCRWERYRERYLGSAIQSAKG